MDHVAKDSVEAESESCRVSLTASQLSQVRESGAASIVNTEQHHIDIDCHAMSS